MVYYETFVAPFRPSAGFVALWRAEHHMKIFSRLFTPTKNRRLNELVGFLFVVSATVLFLALSSYSPRDPSLNTAASLASQSTHNLIHLFCASRSDLLLQSA